MATATEKSAVINSLADTLLSSGRTRVGSISANICATCGEPVNPNGFKDELSKKEYAISGMCQECQNFTVAPPDEDDDTEAWDDLADMDEFYA